MVGVGIGGVLGECSSVGGGGGSEGSVGDFPGLTWFVSSSK